MASWGEENQDLLTELESLLKSRGVLYESIESPTAILDSLKALESYENLEILQSTISLVSSFERNELLGAELVAKWGIEDLGAKSEDQDKGDELMAELVALSEIRKEEWKSWLTDREVEGYIILRPSS